MALEATDIMQPGPRVDLLTENSNMAGQWGRGVESVGGGAVKKGILSRVKDGQVVFDYQEKKFRKRKSRNSVKGKGKRWIKVRGVVLVMFVSCG